MAYICTAPLLDMSYVNEYLMTACLIRLRRFHTLTTLPPSQTALTVLPQHPSCVQYDDIPSIIVSLTYMPRA